MRHPISTLVVSSALIAGSLAAAPVDKTPSVTGTVGGASTALLWGGLVRVRVNRIAGTPSRVQQGAGSDPFFP